MQKGELTKVFGEHAGEFLKFCDGQAEGAVDQALSLDEFTAGKITFRLLPLKVQEWFEPDCSTTSVSRHGILSLSVTS